MIFHCMNIPRFVYPCVYEHLDCTLFLIHLVPFKLFAYSPYLSAPTCNSSDSLWSKIKQLESLVCCWEIGHSYTGRQPPRSVIHLLNEKFSLLYILQRLVNKWPALGRISHDTFIQYFMGSQFQVMLQVQLLTYFLFIIFRDLIVVQLYNKATGSMVTVRTRAKNSLHVNSLNLLHEQLHVCYTSIRLPGLKEHGAIHCNPALCCI